MTHWFKQQYDIAYDKGFKCGRILLLDVLGYADDLSLIGPNVEVMTRRLTALTEDAVRDEADMQMSMPKTFSQHVYRSDKIAVTKAETKAVEEKYKFKCDFCPRCFKTEKACRYIDAIAFTTTTPRKKVIFEVEKL